MQCQLQAGRTGKVARQQLHGFSTSLKGTLHVWCLRVSVTSLSMLTWIIITKDLPGSLVNQDFVLSVQMLPVAVHSCNTFAQPKSFGCSREISTCISVDRQVQIWLRGYGSRHCVTMADTLNTVLLFSSMVSD
ncbi:hypothetical protein ABBQ32_011469 [Trebouxia sp. C0010 RCD-2024]